MEINPMRSLRPMARRFRPALRPLEDRLAPAGVVTVADAAGAVTLTGDDLGNSVHVFRTTPGHYRIEGLDGTTLNGGTVTTIDLARLTGLTFTGNGGSDTLDVANLGPLGGLSFDGGPGADIFRATNLAVTGDVDVAGGTGPDQFNFAGPATVIGRNLRLTGSGGFGCQLGASRLAVGGTMNVDGGAGNAQVQCFAGDVAVGRGIDFNTGTAGGFGGFSLFAAGKCVVGKLPTGESVRMAASGFGGLTLGGDNIALAGGVRLTNNSATPASGLVIFGRVARVGKLPGGASLAVTGGQSISLTGTNLILAGGINFAGGSAGSNLNLTAPAGRAVIGRLASGASIRYTGGAGPDAISLGFGSLTLAGGIEFAPGNGQNLLRVNAPSGAARVGRLATGSSIHFAGGANADTLALDAARLTLAGGIDFAGGAGDNAVHLGESGNAAGQLVIGRHAGGQSIAYTGGADQDTLDFVANSITFAGGIDFGPGNGSNVISSVSLTNFRIGALATGPSVKYAGGDSFDKIDWSAWRAAFQGSIEMAGGAGFDTFNLSALTATVGRTATGDSVRFTGGAGDDSFTVRGNLSPAGAVSIAGDAGFDDLILQGNRLRVGGKVTLDGGPDGDRLFVSALTLALGRGLAVAGGDGDDFFELIANGTVHGDVDIDLGPLAVGTQSANLGDIDGRVNGLVIQGSLTVTSTGAAGSADSVNVTNVAVGGAFTAALGAGASTVTLDNLSVGGALTVDTNGGNDVVQFERSNVFGNSTVGGAATIRTGDGNDSVRIGSPDPDPNGGDADSTRVRFRAGLTLDGGAGTDTRNAIDTENDFPGGPPAGLGTFETVVA
jgi:hypothetical protein